MTTNTKKLVKIAILSALAALFFYLDFPIFPAAPFLKLDFGSVFSLLGGFMFSPVAGVAIEFFRVVLGTIIDGGSTTFYVGELSSLIYGLCFVLPASILYQRYKGIKAVLFELIISVLFVCIVATLLGYYLIFPFYNVVAGGHLQKFLTFKFAMSTVLPFNLIKYTASAIVTFFIYKRVKFLFEKI